MKRRGFTLVEVLVVISIIGLLTAMFLGALSASQNAAREARSKSIVVRISDAVSQRWETYRTRRLPMNPSDPATITWASSLGINLASSTGVARARLEMLREMQRLEMPQCWADIANGTWPNARLAATVPGLFSVDPNDSTILYGPAVSNGYLRAYNASNIGGVQIQPTTDYEGAECLYLIVTMGGLEEDSTAVDHFRQTDVGDFDHDGMKEFHDGWGNPISWVRWPTMFVSDQQQDITLIEANGAAAVQSFCREYHDPFDPARVDMPASGATVCRGFKLVPLVMSAGPDGSLGVERGSAGNDPYSRAGTPAGTQTEQDGLGWLDNIDSHNIGQSIR